MDYRMNDRAMARREMRDMARRERRMRDGRNPYGSMGGYVSSYRPRRRDREMEDMAQNRGRSSNSNRGRNDYGYDYEQYDSDYGSSNYRGYDNARNSMDYEQYRQSDRNRVPFEVYGNVDMGDYARRRNSRGQFMRDREMDGHYPYMPPMFMDYGEDYGDDKLSEEDLKEWYEDLCKEIPEQYKHLYKKEKIEEVAKQMQIDFDKFKPMELVVTTTMLATDYPKSVGFADINRNVAMAKEWLNDPDSNLKGSQKLSAYYDNVVKG